MKINFKILIIFIAANFNSCFKDELIIDEVKDVVIDHPKKKISCDVAYATQDEFGNYIGGYSTSFGGSETQVNKNGIYHFYRSDIYPNSTITTKNIENTNFETGTILLNSEVNYGKQTIITEPQVTEFDNNTTNEFEIGKNLKIRIPENSFSLNGVDYLYPIELKTFNPELGNPVHLEAIPGNHLAINNDNHEVFLDYIEVIMIDFKLNSGETPDIRQNKVLVNFSGNYETDFDIWRYETQEHLWKLYKSAYQISNNSFPISQNGFYCIAKQKQYNTVEGKVLIGQNPLINYPVDIYTGDRLIKRAYTTNTGRWIVNLPINGNYLAKIKTDNDKTFELTFDTDELELIIDPLLIESSEVELLNIEGQVFNCENMEISSSFIVLSQDEQKSYFFSTDSKIDLSVIKTSINKTEIELFDQDMIEASPKIDYEPDKSNINLLKTYCCNVLKSGFLRLIIDGKGKIFTAIETKKLDDGTAIIAYDEYNLTSELFIVFDGFESREYLDKEINVDLEKIKIQNKVYDFNCLNSTLGCGFHSFEIQSFGEKKGTWIQGDFNGEFWIKTYDPLEVSYKKIEGEFFVQRNFN